MSRKKISFEDRLARLETIRESIEDESNGLEESMKLFEEGIALSHQLSKELNSMEARIEILINEPDDETEPEFEEFTAE